MLIHFFLFANDRHQLIIDNYNVINVTFSMRKKERILDINFVGIYGIKKISIILLSRGETMRLTRASEYAIRCILYLSNKEKGLVVNRKEIAREMDIPNEFLGKIAQQLSRSGILEIVQGPKGGLRLSISPEKLSLLDVVEAIMGEIFLNDCILKPDSCGRSYTCAVHFVWQKAKNQLRETLREATFAKLVKDDGCTTRSIPLGDQK